MPSPVARHSGFFALRTPLLPFDTLLAWAHGAEAPSAAGADLDEAVRADRERLEARLRALVLDPVVREALFVASPSLDRAIDAWLADPSTPRARGVIPIVARYLARMAARPTPFGLFSGCSVGTLGGRETTLAVPGQKACRRHTRLDMHYLCALTAALDGDPGLQQTLRYRPSSGLQDNGADLRHIEARIDPVTRARTHHLLSVEATSHLRAALLRARAGATAAEIAAAVIAHDPAVAEDAPAFVQAMIERGILVSELGPTVTGPSPIRGVIEVLERQPAGAVTAGRLSSVNAALERLDLDRLGAPTERYRAIADQLRELPIGADPARLFHVDLFKDGAGATIGGEVLREIERVIPALARLAIPSPHEGLRRFREAFDARYGEQEVPLLEALDDERGVGFDGAGRDPAPLLEGLPFDPGAAQDEVIHGARERWITRRVIELCAAGEREWRLTEQDIEALAADEPVALPGSFALMVTLAAASPEALRDGDVQVVLRSFGGPPGVALLGRFCLGDDVLRRAAAAHLREEEALSPGATVAEIVHLPQGRLGNILCRPVLRDHEIVYLGASGADEACQISAADLRVSVRGGRVVLRSAALDREVVPRLSSAHNHATADLGVYRFLCALGRQTGAFFGWSFGPVAESAPFLPRVTLGKLVLSVARYALNTSEIGAISRGSAAERFGAVRALRAARGLPRWVAVADGDNLLPVDLDNVVSVAALIDLVKSRGRVALEELFPAPEALCATGEDGRYTHEVILPFVRVGPGLSGHVGPASGPSAPVGSSHGGPPRGPGVRRSFAPGSSWLYVKIYTGTATADRVLREVVAPIVRAPGRAFGRWFFLRYGDPDWHLRVRFEGEPRALLGEVLPALREALDPLIEERTVRRFEIGTYEREVERYGGGRGVVLAESIFHADSEAALALIEETAGDQGSTARWRLSLVGMHRLTAALGLDLDARMRLVRAAREGLWREMAAGVALDRQLGATHRRERAVLAALLAAEPGSEHPLSLGLEVLAARDAAIATTAAELRDAEAAGDLSRSVEEICTSFVHMHVNRLLRSDQRRHELVLHDLLLRLYRTEAARQRG